MSIEGITLEHFSSLPKSYINSTTPTRQRHTVFQYFLSGNIKHDASTTTAHGKRLILLLKTKIIDKIIG